MKPRHAAALALVGWYLMTPSHHREARTVRGQIGNELVRKSENGRTFDLVDLGRMLAQCIATDDPGLKEK
jgi:hypothetical protein